MLVIESLTDSPKDIQLACREPGLGLVLASPTAQDLAIMLHWL